MSCEIKNEKSPFRIQCFFQTATNDKQHFSLYFYSSQGSQEQVVGCAYNGRHRCFHENDFNVTHEGYNDVTITVTDTFATGAGEFGCQKGDIPMGKRCPYSPVEISGTISNTKSGIGLGTTTKDMQSSLTTEQFGNEGDSPAVPVAAIVAPIVVIVLTIIIGFLLFKKCRSKCSSETPKKTTIYSVCPSALTSEECKKPSLGIENTGNHEDPTQTECASASCMGVILRTNIPIVRYGQTTTKIV